MTDGDNYIFLEKGLGKCSRMTNVKGCQVRSCGSIWESLLFIRGFPHSSVGKESICSAGDPDLIPGLGRSAGEAIGYPLQYSWASLVAQLVMNLPAMQETWVWTLVGKIPWRRERLPTPVFWPGEFHGLYSACVAKSKFEGAWLLLSGFLDWLCVGSLDVKMQVFVV